ncbi:proline rich protein kinase like protein [Thalassiosira pseudonana CCMP1335]
MFDQYFHESLKECCKAVFGTTTCEYDDICATSPPSPTYGDTRNFSTISCSCFYDHHSGSFTSSVDLRREKGKSHSFIAPQSPAPSPKPSPFPSVPIITPNPTEEKILTPQPSSPSPTTEAPVSPAPTISTPFPVVTIITPIPTEAPVTPRPSFFPTASPSFGSTPTVSDLVC